MEDAATFNDVEFTVEGRQFIVLTLQGAQMVALALPLAP